MTADAQRFSTTFVSPYIGCIVTLAGIWENEYGSRMALAVERGRVSGIYDSTTGATGRYLVSGWQTAADPKPDHGQPVALNIAWHSVTDDPPDAGWHWVSSLSGQISIVDGEELLIVTHLLVATRGFEGLCERGIYTDRLTYRRVAADVPHLVSRSLRANAADDALAGIWRANDGSALDVQVTSDGTHPIGLVEGTLALISGKLEILGFTDINASKDGAGFQSVALAALDKARNVAIALGGWIDDQTGALTLHSLTSQSTSAGNIWIQTAIWPLELNRPPKS